MKVSVLVLVLLALFGGVAESQFIPIFDWVRSFFGKYEEPNYVSIKNLTEDVEERSYPPTKWVCTESFLTPDQKDAKTSEMFMTLFRYIQGRNEGSVKIEMTVPVATKVDHRNGKLRSYEMCFYIPLELQTSPPKSSDPKVKVVSFPALHVYSKRYGGYSNQERETEQFWLLANALKNQSVPYFEERDGDRATYFFAGYDSPTKFWSRRNEVWVLASDTAPSINNHFNYNNN